MVDVCEGHGVGDSDTTLVLSTDEDLRGTLVQADTEALELGLYDFLVTEGLEDIENDEDEVASASDGDD